MDRRRFLASVSGSLIGLAGGPSRPSSAAQSPAPRDSRSSAAEPAYRVIDTHLHLFDTALQGRSGVPRYLSQDATVEAALHAMERGGVGKAFLISDAAEDVAVQIRRRGFDPAAIKNVVSKQYQVEAWKKHPDRFWWFTDHIDPTRPSYLDDLDRDFDLGAAGIKMLPWFHGVLPDHPAYLRVYELCRKRRKPVILDLSWWYFDQHPLVHETPARQNIVRSFADYARLLSPLFRQFEDVPFSLAHCGTARTTDEYRDIFPLIAAHPNVSCDVAAATGYSAAFIERLAKAVGAHKVMYGTDWPYWSSGPESYVVGRRRWGMIADECPRLSRTEKEQILAANAERFVKNELPDDRGSRARRLHERAIVVVIHDHNPIAPDVIRMRRGGVTAKVYQLGVDVDPAKNFRASALQREGWAARTQAALDDARRVIAADPEHVLLALQAADIERAKREGKSAILLGVEGAKLLEGDLSNVRAFYKKGLRELQLRWAVPNQLVEKDSLTEFGRAVVEECQQLGMIVDLTHIPERAFFQAIALARRPLIVSHGTGRELGERRVRAIADRHGVVGVHFYSSYLGPRPNVLQVLDAIDTLVRLGGMGVVALGIDFFPSQGKWRDFQQAQGTQDISWAIPDLEHLPEITRGLVARGYKDDEILAILGQNFLRVCNDVLGG
jgi:membrane dipeptidase